MKKIFILLAILVLFINLLKSQITYSTSEMPIPGDTFRLSSAATTGGIDYTLTGTNYTWNFSNLNHLNQTIDTFVSVTSVPAIYQLIFNSVIYPNNRATVAKHQNSSPIPIPNLPINNVYSFFRNTSSFYALVGYGANVSGTNLPIRFNNVDYIYRFPLLQGNIDSCVSDFGVSIPSIGYFGETKKRKNIVDGWGTLITPYGTFQTIRVKSELFMHDTLYYNSIPYYQDRSEVEYKWLANGFAIPILSITNGTTGLQVQYIDSIRSSPMSINKKIKINNIELSVFPNPCNKNVSISYLLEKKSFANVSLINLKGEKIITFVNCEQLKGKYIYQFDISDDRLAKGIYFIRLSTNNNIVIKKLMIN